MPSSSSLLIRLALSCVCLLGSGVLQANNAITPSLNSAFEQKLDLHPTWLRLLHFDEENPKRSEVISKSFFLASNGASSPRDELSATLRAFFRAIESTEQHAACDFPARRYWLEQKLPALKTHLSDLDCPELATWLEAQSLETVSLMYVNGYFGNPASSFGHMLLRLHQPTQEQANALFSHGVNFGAKVPEDENVFLYIYRGLTGFYTAGFTDLEYYLRDLVYSKRDSRDIWEYTLKLSEQQRHLLAYHLWELLSVEFDYFFLKQNCAYHIGQLLEVALDRNLLNQSQLWASPLEVLQAVAPDSFAADKIRFHSSPQRRLQQAYTALPTPQKQRASQFIEKPEREILQSSRALPSHPQLIEFLLDYFEAETALLETTLPAELEQGKNLVLRERLRLPIAPKPRFDLSAQSAPNHRPHPTELRAGFLQSGSQGALSLGFTGYNQDLHSADGEAPAQFTVASASAQFAAGELSLHELRLLDIWQLAAAPWGFPKQKHHSWSIQTGLLNRDVSRPTEHSWQFGGGIGLPLWQARNQTAYMMLDGYLEDRGQHYALRPRLGGIWRQDAVSLHAELGTRWAGSSAALRFISTLELRYRLNKDLRIGVKAAHESTELWSLQLHWTP